MKFDVRSELSYSLNGPSTMLLKVHALSNASQYVTDERFNLSPKIRWEECLLDQGQNRFVRLMTGATKELMVTYRSKVSTNIRLIPVRDMKPTSIGQMDRGVIPYVYPSRYCQSDRLAQFAIGKFAMHEDPFLRVTAISNWIHRNIKYQMGSTNWQTSACDTIVERVGVCRDFAHLGIALCRAINIPARYVAAYCHQLDPPDYHACFDAHIGGIWLTFDPTRLVPLNGLVRISLGHDAAEGAVATIFGPARSKSIMVSCEPVGSGFKPLQATGLDELGVCFDRE